MKHFALLFVLLASSSAANSQDAAAPSDTHRQDVETPAAPPAPQAPGPTPIYPAPVLQMGNGQFWAVFAPLKYEILKTGKVITVPKGFVTDLTSVPRPLWSILPPNGNYMAAAIVHDYLYWDQRCSRAEADAVFDLAMKESRVADNMRWSLYQGVKTGGAASWRKNAQLKRKREVRFFTDSYIERMLEMPIDAKKTLSSIQIDARSRGGNSEDNAPNADIRDACKAALTATNN